MPTCSFCKKNYEFPRGLTIFTIDGRSVYFCSSKCKRNLNLKRDPKKVNWVKREKKVKDKSADTKASHPPVQEEIGEKVGGKKKDVKEKKKVKKAEETKVGKKEEKVKEEKNVEEKITNPPIQEEVDDDDED